MTTDLFDRKLDDVGFIDCLRTYIPNYLQVVLDTYQFKKYDWIFTCCDPLLIELIQLCHLKLCTLKTQDIHVVFYRLSLAIRSHYKSIELYYQPV